MSIPPKSVWFDEARLWIELEDGRIVGAPLSWFPRLLHASSDERTEVQLSRRGLHWETLDEDISIDGLLHGRGDAAGPEGPGAGQTLVNALGMPRLAGIEFDPPRSELKGREADLTG